MYIIVGLGNPGTQYMGTRHNAGFSVIDALADQYNISVDTQKHKGMIGKGMIEGEKVILVKPMTYMNLSGECIREVMDYYKADTTVLKVLSRSLAVTGSSVLSSVSVTNRRAGTLQTGYSENSRQIYTIHCGMPIREPAKRLPVS